MDFRKLAVGALLAGVVFEAPRASANSTGIMDVNKPGQGCTCHAPTLPPNTTTQVVILGLPSGGYAPGCSYGLTVVVVGVAVPAPQFAGFDLGATAGTLASANDTAQVRNMSQCEFLETFGLCLPGSALDPCAPGRCDQEEKTQATHTTVGPLGAGLPPIARFTWDLTWTAPTSSDPVTFYLAGNVVNGVLGNAGDEWSVLDPPTVVSAAPAGTTCSQ